jgi:hypothetical protein
VLESPRIRSGVKLEAVAATAEQSLQWELSDTITRSGHTSKQLSHNFSGEQVNVYPRLSIGIRDKFELGGHLYGPVPLISWEGRLKLALFEYGSPRFFRNIAAATLVGSRGFKAEWDDANRNWGGFSFGTLHKHSILELEYIVMPTLGYNTFGSTDDGIGTGSISFYDISLTTGLSLNVTRRLYTSIALSYAYDFNPHQKISKESLIKAISFDAQPYSFNAALGYRFGQSKP